MAEPIPQGTMIVKDPWEEAFASYRQALIDLDGDGVPDVAVPTGRPPQAFDPDGKPRVPASDSSNPYPFPVGAYPPNPTMLDQAVNNPGSVIMGGIQRTMSGLSAAADAMGPTGMPISMLGRMGMAAVRTPGAALGRGPSPQFQVDKLRDEIRTMPSLPERAFPQPMDGNVNRMLETLRQQRQVMVDDLPEVQRRAQEAAQQGLAEYTNRLLALQNGPPALTYTPNARFEAVLGGMNSQRGGAVRPEANPYGAGGVAQREAAAAERGRFRMERNARAADELASPTNQRINRDLAIDQTAQNVLGNVGRAAGAADDAIAQLPRGAYERALANEPTLQILAQNYGMTIDDIVAALARRGYAVPPNARFNANVMQQYQSGRSGALPMTAEEKSFRDAMHRRNRRPEGGQRATGDAF